MDRRMATASLFVFFALAWLPLDHQSFVIAHWMKIGAFVAPIIVFFAFLDRAEYSKPWSRDVRLMACLLTAAYLIHQVEEHWFDLLGREYPLYDYLNQLIADLFGENRYGVLDRTGIFFINAGMVWTAGFLAILTSTRQVFPSLALAGLMLVNSIAHVLNALITASYNSGLATSLVLFMPLSITFFLAVYRTRQSNAKLIPAAILWGLLAHIILFAGLFASVVQGLLPTAVYFSALIVWGGLPTVVFTSRTPD